MGFRGRRIDGDLQIVRDVRLGGADDQGLVGVADPNSRHFRQNRQRGPLPKCLRRPIEDRLGHMGLDEAVGFAVPGLDAFQKNVFVGWLAIARAQA